MAAPESSKMRTKTGWRELGCCAFLVILINMAAGYVDLAEAQQTSTKQSPSINHPYDDEEKARRKAALTSFTKLLATAESEKEGQKIANQIWKFWLIGPDEQATKRLAAGMRAREAYNYEKALSIFQALVESYPRFTEARNQRAFIYFLTGDLDASLADLDTVVSEIPDHFAAHAGRGLVLLQQGRTRAAQTALKKARSIHPWINERHLIVE